MANIEKSLISRILFNDEWSVVVDRKVEATMFEGTDTREGFLYLKEFYENYGTLPSIDLFEEEFPTLKLKYAKEPCEYYIDKLMEVYIRNKGSKVLLDNARTLMVKPKEGMEKLRSDILGLSVEVDPTRDVGITKTAKERKERYLRVKNMGGVDGYKTPWEVLDDATMGFHEGEFIAIVSRPGVGKSFLLTIFAEHAYRNDLRVLFITNEMADVQIMQRFDAVHFKLPYTELRAGLLPDHLEEKYFSGLGEMSENEENDSLIVISDVHGVASIGAKIDQYKPDIVMIDGLYLLHDDKAAHSKWESTTNISRDIKRLARKKRVPILATTQFNRAADEIRMDKVTLSNLGFSDSIGQDADVVLGLFRTRDMELNNEMMVRMLKVREGEPKDFTLMWDLRSMRFPVLDTDSDNAFLNDDEEHIDF